MEIKRIWRYLPKFKYYLCMKREHYIPFDKEFLLEQQQEEYIGDKKEAEDFKKYLQKINNLRPIFFAQFTP